MAFARCATTIGWILLSVAISGADLDRAVVSQMRVTVPGTDQIRVVARVQAAPELDLVVLLAGSKDLATGPGPMAMVGQQQNARDLSAAFQPCRHDVQSCSSKRSR